ncbi:unnamed protein product [Medioppia subpectinata]|uniref:Uncharacterized protein n=1 Tax=Medioppia subpectinata TaxID=1979941 RepID=A0A7R9KX89_9ACAR|nr:unnamed protein product [Medioppia subpectinata]CAG2111503.1 unnamed protein product [Medioppia subpectinata]
MYELIRSKEENERLKQVVINNRLKQLQCNESVVSLGYCNSSLTTNHSLTNTKQIDNNCCQEIDILLENTINTSAEELREQIRDIENSVTNNIFTASNEESPELPVIPVFRELIDYKGLNQLECNRMQELMTTSNKFVTDLISFAQHLMTFNNICPNDRLALVKYGGKDLISVQIDLCMFEQTHYNSLKYYYGQFLLVWDYSDPIIINLGWAYVTRS